jgi:hypothetical protein
MRRKLLADLLEQGVYGKTFSGAILLYAFNAVILAGIFFMLWWAGLLFKIWLPVGIAASLMVSESLWAGHRRRGRAARAVERLRKADEDTE